MPNFINEISKVYNNRLNSQMKPSLAKIFESSNFEKDFYPYRLSEVIPMLQDLKHQGILDLTVDGSFILTDFGISQL